MLLACPPRWAQSTEYKALLSKNRANRVQYTEFMGPAQAGMYGLSNSSRVRSYLGAEPAAATSSAPASTPGDSSSVGSASAATAGPQQQGAANVTGKSGQQNPIGNVSSSKWGSGANRGSSLQQGPDSPTGYHMWSRFLRRK